MIEVSGLLRTAANKSRCLRSNFSKVKSVRSTISKIAAYCGLPGYLLYPMFDLPESVVSFAGQEFDDMRSVVRVREMDDLLRQPGSPETTDDLPSLYWEAVTGEVE